ncbi:MAG TPA: type IV secretion system protein [Candidatus Limnocylindria bacterium]|nr:type IV secretion system protein [Candidatus Limnocylindria bacterium]
MSAAIDPALVRRLRRWLVVGGIAASALFVLVMFAPTIASAQFDGFDPAGTVENLSASNNWLGQAQMWAQRIYLTLMVFELFALGVTTLLFRENLGEFFASVSLKIVMGGIFFWLIANSGVAGLPGRVVATFTQFGQQLAGNTADPTQLAVEGLASATGYFAASQLAKTDDDATATAADVPPNCTFIAGTGDCTIAPSFELMTTHAVFEVVASALGVMIVMAVAAIYLQFALITIESYLVMTAGTLFIGFAGSRFTMPFSQGYFSYMINVGVKVMVMYIILGVEGPLLTNIMISSFASLTAAAADPTGASIAAALAAASYGVFSVVIGAALVWTIPGFAASFLTGQSNASGAAVLQQTLGAVAGSAQMMAQMANSGAHLQNAARDLRGADVGRGPASRSANEQMAPAAAVPGGGTQSFQPAGASAGAGAGESGAANGVTDALQMTSQPQRITVQSPDVLTPSAPPALTRGRSEVLSPLGERMDTGTAPAAASGGRSLQEMTPAEIRNLPATEARRLAASGNAERLSAEQQAGLRENEAFVTAYREAKVGDAVREERSAELAAAYGLGGLAQAAPHEVGTPTAVEVRLGNPDRL